MLAIRIEDILVKQVDMLAKAKHSSRSAIVREAIIRLLEDNEDLELALFAQKHSKSTKKLAQLKKELGLDVDG